MNKCIYCKIKYEPVRKTQKYCGRACRMADYWTKKVKEQKK